MTDRNHSTEATQGGPTMKIETKHGPATADQKDNGDWYFTMKDRRDLPPVYVSANWEGDKFKATADKWTAEWFGTITDAATTMYGWLLDGTAPWMWFDKTYGDLHALAAEITPAAEHRFDLHIEDPEKLHLDALRKDAAQRLLNLAASAVHTAHKLMSDRPLNDCGELQQAHSIDMLIARIAEASRKRR